jgi:hypothetical protein
MIVNGEIYKLPYTFYIEELNSKDVIRSFNRKTDKPLFIAIIKEYCQIITNSLIDGYSWIFPKSLGEITIVKKDINKEWLKTNKGVSTPKLGYYYSYSVKSEVLSKNGVELILEPEIMDKINDLISTTEKDYRYER